MIPSRTYATYDDIKDGAVMEWKFVRGITNVIMRVVFSLGSCISGVTIVPSLPTIGGSVRASRPKNWRWFRSFDVRAAMPLPRVIEPHTRPLRPQKRINRADRVRLNRSRFISALKESHRG